MSKNESNKTMSLSKLAAASLLVAFSTIAFGTGLPEASPEEVGMSSERLARVKAYFDQEVEDGRLPGGVIAVARQGKLVMHEAFGVQNPNEEAQMPTDAIFRIYSMTKPLVSVAAMLLVEDGKIHLTDPVSKWLPEFENMNVSTATTDANGNVTYEQTPAKRIMTVQDLLRHTAGLAYGEINPNEQVKEGYQAAGAYNPGEGEFDSRNVTPAEQVSGIASTPLVHEPGTVWEYSVASDILGRVVESASDKTLGQFLEERVFSPLKMHDTGFHVAESELTRLAEAFETDPWSERSYPLLDVAAPPKNDSGGAGAVSTARDYLRFSQMLLNGGKLDDVQIMSPTTIRLMASDHLGDRKSNPMSPGALLLGTPEGYTFGLGFLVREKTGMAGVHGSADEFMWAGYAGTFFWVDPTEELAVVLMTQQSGPSRGYYRRAIKNLVAQAIVE